MNLNAPLSFPKGLMANRNAKDRVDVHGIRELFQTSPANLIMTLCFVPVLAIVVSETSDPALRVLGFVGVALQVVRQLMVLALRHRVNDLMLSVEEARHLEFIFAVIYGLFAAVFGLWCARIALIEAPQVQMLSLTLLMGYGAGVSAYIPLRPRIAVAAMLLAVVPSIATFSLKGDKYSLAAAFLLLAFLGGGLHRILRTNALSSDIIMRRDAFFLLARTDALTGLVNRLALDEWFALRRNTAAKAVLFLDLDRFKQVNDTLGHRVGDKLLKAVAGRLSALSRHEDVVARVGGDEFVIVLENVGSEEDAEAFAERIVDGISKPYSIGGHAVEIGGSIGFVIVAPGEKSLDKWISRADQLMYQVKRSGRSVAAYQPL
jgi:diguanylate cyclase (GGDEF)-like protein